MNIISIREFRKNIKRYLDMVFFKEEVIAVTRYGHGKAILLCYLEYNRLKDLEEQSKLTDREKKVKAARIRNLAEHKWLYSERARRKLNIPMD